MRRLGFAQALCEGLRPTSPEFATQEPSRSPWLKLLRAALDPQIRAWRGELPLPIVFWGHGAFVSGVMILAFIDAMFRRDAVTQQVLLTLLLLYTPWVLVAVWRCAANATPPWDVMARLVTIAWGLNTFMVGGFLQLDLLRG